MNCPPRSFTPRLTAVLSLFSRRVLRAPRLPISLLAGSLLSIFTLTASAAPTGRVWLVAQENPRATDAGPGDAAQPFKTISRAVAAAMPGDTVRVQRGVYRERVAPERGGEPDRTITYEAAPGETVIVSGADRWAPAWRDEPGQPGVRSAILDLPVSGSYHPFHTAYLMQSGRSLGQVFVDGRAFAEMTDRAELARRPGTWWFDASSNRLYLHFPPAAADVPPPTVEVTMRDRLFTPRVRGLGHIVVRGFIFERAANQFPLRFWVTNDPVNSYPQAGAVSTRSGHDWIIEDNTIRDAKSVALDCGDEGGRDFEGNQPKPAHLGHHVIRRNTICDNGASGIMGLGAHGTHIVSNVVERNNTLGNTAPECAGIKVHDFIDGVIADNLIRDNGCAGIWIDNVYTHARVTRNVVVNNEDMGIFIELGHGPCLLDHNIVAFTRGDGIYTHDASGVTIAHNLLFSNAHFGVYAHVISPRKARAEDGTMQTVETSHQRVCNNIFVDNLGGAISLPGVSPRSTDNASDYNLFLTGTQGIWENERFTSFRINNNGGTLSPTDLAATIRAKAGVDSTPNLPFAAWQRASGWDTHSIALVIENKRPPEYLKGAGPERSARFAARELYVEFLDGGALQRLHCPPVPGVDRDFFGTPLPVATPGALAGPFQTVTAEKNRFVLWPPADHPEQRK